MSPTEKSDLDQMSRESTDPPLWREFLSYLRETGKWWLLPILLSCAALAILSWFAGTAVAPFIYPLF